MSPWCDIFRMDGHFLILKGRGLSREGLLSMHWQIKQQATGSWAGFPEFSKVWLLVHSQECLTGNSASQTKRENTGIK